VPVNYVNLNLNSVQPIRNTKVVRSIICLLVKHRCAIKFSKAFAINKHKSHKAQQNLTSHAYVPHSLIYIMHHKFTLEYQKTKILI